MLYVFLVFSWMKTFYWIHLIYNVFFLITGGGEKARARHVSRGKLLPRERIDNLIDPGLVHTQVLAQGVLCSWCFLGCFFLFWLCCAALGILVPQPGVEPKPVAARRRVLTIGPPGNSHLRKRCEVSGFTFWFLPKLQQQVFVVRLLNVRCYSRC